MQVDLAGKVILVTGSTGGIGRTVAELAARNGAIVVLNGRRAEPAQEVLAAITGEGGAATFEQADVSDSAQVEHMCRRVVDRYGRLDGLVASTAGTYIQPRLFLETNPQTFLDYFHGEFLAKAYPVWAAARHMAQQGYGKIVMTTTDAGRTPSPGEVIIGAAGAAAIMMVRAAARELARHGVRLNTIALTLTADTPAYERYLAGREREDEVLWRSFAKLEQRIPFGLNKPADIAHLALYLLAPESDQVTGMTISVNGGLSFP